MKQILLLTAALLALLSAGTASAAAQPRITWSPPVISGVTLAPGESATYSVTIRNDGLSEIPNARQLKVLARGAIAPYVTIAQPAFPQPALARGAELSFTVTLTAPAGATAATYTGRLVVARVFRNGNIRNVIWKRALSVELLVSTDLLPPDPGEPGKLTISGIDSDQDGVRDDIQRYIHFTYDGQDQVQAALTEVAKQYQGLLADAADHDAAFNHATAMARHGECLDYLKGEAAADMLGALRAEVLNTRERSIAYITYGDTLGGEIILGKPLAEWKGSCAFDVDSMGADQ